jgi:phenylacetate-CoA ligase
MSDSASFKLYSKLPIWAQNIACSLAGVQMRRTRYNRVFRQALAFLEESQWWPLEKLQAYQDEQLRRVIRHAYDTVPYYQEVFERLNLTPDDILTAADLPKLPILEKGIVRERFRDLQSQGWPQARRVFGHTGGTTGKALDIVSDRDTQPWQWAVCWRHRQRFGVKLHDEFIVFAGRSVIPLSNMNPPFWRRNWPMHQTYVSIHHLTRQNMPALVEYLQTRKAAYYSGYPSGLYLVASYLLENKIRLKHPPRVISTGSETVLPHQRSVIQEGFQAVLADNYAATEQCVSITECEQHNYHVDMEFGAVEFVAIEGLPANVRRIVCTGFRNPAMPLIRYSIGDIATLKEGMCPCGRKAPMVERIDGRIESYICTPDGRQLGRLDFLFKASHRINEAQLIQEELESVIVRVVKAEGFGPADEESLRHDLSKYLGDQIRLQIEYVSEIPREANGKFRQIVSRVFQDRYAPGAPRS